MPRLLVHVEGQTEETFVKEVLRPHLHNYGYEGVSARIVGNARQRGGIRSWSSVRDGILNHLKEDAGSVISTMVDYYGLPQTGGKAWPGRTEAGALAFEQRARSVENALLTDVCREMGRNFDSSRFIPFVVMHEFEGLLFSDCSLFAKGIERPDLAPKFQAIRDQFSTPEEINDSPITAPSKRVQNLVPGYQKPLFGAFAILEIGLDKIRSECPHFRSWIERLEAWPVSRK